MDTPSIDQIVDSEMGTTEPLQVEQQEVSTEPNPEVAPEAKAEEETFVAVDPKTLSPEMQAEYKRWQSAYTKKRQAEKAELEEYRAKVAQFEQQPTQTANQTQITNSYQQDRANGAIDPNMSLADYTKAVIDQAKAEIKVENENQYIESAEKEFYTLDPRLDANNEATLDRMCFNYVAGEVSAARDSYEAQHGTVIGFDFKGETLKRIEEFDARFAQSNKAFIQKQSEIAKSKANQFAKANPTATTTSSKPAGMISIDDAFDAAMDELHGKN